MISRTRLAGAWTRLDADNEPLGRLHAARRINGSLDTHALCGYKIPERELRLRPFPTFTPNHSKVCPICAAEAEDLP